MTEPGPDPQEHEFQIHGLAARYGRKVVVSGFDARVASGQALAIAGANGAGKSSLLGALAGLIASRGEVVLDDRAVAPTLAARQAAGIRLVPEQGKIYPTLTVHENLAIGNRVRGDVGIDDVHGWFPRLAERRKTQAGNLSGGEQQMLAIGMAVLGSPRVLLLDEPTLGLSVPVIEDLASRLAELRRALRLIVLVAESDVTWLPALTDRAVVIDRGGVTAVHDAYTDDTLHRIEASMVGLESLT